MSGEHFTLTISQSTADSGDFAIHLRDKKRNREHFLMHLRFAESVLVDESFMDDLVSVVARCLARRLLGQTPRDDAMPTPEEEEKARKVVVRALEKMRRT